MVMGGTVMVTGGGRLGELGFCLGGEGSSYRRPGMRFGGGGGCVCLWSCSVVWGAGVCDYVQLNCRQLGAIEALLKCGCHHTVGDESMVESLLTCCMGFSGQSHLFKAFRTVSLSQCCAGSSASCSESILHSLSSNLKSLPQVEQCHAHIISLGHD
ncbi:unnamed protein product [Ilex paraguariensis]|uniref:Uncharacterized protein n=1 Tax=Ilex paraguariensis TaxID=185542 RepID=A0ABC8V3Z2_9AQUA